MMGGRTVKGTPFVFWLILAGFEANSTISASSQRSMLPYTTAAVESLSIELCFRANRGTRVWSQCSFHE